MRFYSTPLALTLLYSTLPHQMERYKEGPRGKPPHVFAVGHRAYYEMLGERKPQASFQGGGRGGGGDVCSHEDMIATTVVSFRRRGEEERPCGGERRGREKKTGEGRVSCGCRGVLDAWFRIPPGGGGFEEIGVGKHVEV